MAVNNKMFSSVSSFSGGASRKRINREYMLSSETAKALNSYLGNQFQAPIDNPDLENTYPQEGETPKEMQYAGPKAVRSLFNKFHAVGLGKTDNENEKALSHASNIRINNNVPLMDSSDNRRRMRNNSGCSIKELVQRSEEGFFGTAVYSYSDFMYCKYLGKVPNTYLITLRRYPIPVNDSMMPLDFGDSRKLFAQETPAVPTGTMVTWLGVSGNEMKNILTYEYNMSFQEKQAGWQDIQKVGGGDGGVLNTLEAAINPTTRANLASGGSIPAGNSITSMIGGLWGINKLGGDSTGPYTVEPFWDSNRIHGPVDRVKSNYMRGEDGLQWKQSFTITFDYELRAYNGINPRQAMLDLIGNILTTTYTTGGFWKGGYKPLGVTQSSVFSRLSIFKAKGGFSSFMDAISEDIGGGGKNSTGGLKSMLSEFASNPGKYISKALNALGGLVMGTVLNKLGRPAKYRYPALLSDAPAGFWHITIGNPNHPIMSIGNLILKSAKIEHSGPLGLDDFPTNLRVICSFDRGKPRDQLYNESIYMSGNDRIYMPMDAEIAAMYESSKKLGSVGSDEGSKTIDSLTTQDSQNASKIWYDESAGNWGLKYFGTPDLDPIRFASRELWRGQPKPKTETTTQGQTDKGNTKKPK